MTFSKQEKLEILSEILEKVDLQYRDIIANYFISCSDTMNTHSYEVLRCYCKVPYKDLDGFLKNVLYSTYCAWFCYMEDPNFLDGFKEFFEELPENKEVFESLYKNDPVFRSAFDKLKVSLGRDKK